jgi:hypothetical protein
MDKRKWLIENLATLPESWQDKFKLMYGMNGGKRTAHQAVAMSIEEVVLEVPSGKLRWAVQQVKNSHDAIPKAVLRRLQG